LEEKKKVYELYGVKEYTVIDPATKGVTVYTIQEKSFSIAFEGTQIVQSPLLNNRFEF
jgi:Uma2 family endonuclease